MKNFNSLNYSLYLIFHPFDGFWDLKHEKRGSAKSAALLFLILSLTFILRNQFTSYLFNEQRPEQLSVLRVVIISVGPYLLWCLSNWCFTSLMDGEGSMKDIFISTGYALTPMIIINIVIIIASWIFTKEESAVIFFIDGLKIFWTYTLIFIGMLVTHQYTVRKSILTSLLTITGMMVIIFIGLLLFYLVQQMTGFISDVYMEAVFRFS